MGISWCSETELSLLGIGIGNVQTRKCTGTNVTGPFFANSGG